LHHLVGRAVGAGLQLLFQEFLRLGAEGNHHAS
jgi:hypothetical protein